MKKDLEQILEKLKVYIGENEILDKKTINHLLDCMSEKVTETELIFNEAVKSIFAGLSEEEKSRFLKLHEMGGRFTEYEEDKPTPSYVIDNTKLRPLMGFKSCGFTCDRWWINEIGEAVIEKIKNERVPVATVT